MIVKTLSTWEVADLLLADENANWSRAGSLAMADWLEEVSDESDTPQEFDRVAVRCDFSEYQNLFAFAQEYFSDADRMCFETGIDTNDDDESEAEKIRDFIRDRGILIEFTGGVIVSNF